MYPARKTDAQHSTTETRARFCFIPGQKPLSPSFITSTLSSAFLLLALLSGLSTAQARPKYARAEHKGCGYCHIDEAGGGPRNYRGIYYGAHGHSFDGFVDNGPDGAPAPPTGAPFSWQLILSGKPGRVAIADLAGDGKQRVALVNAGKDEDSRVLSITRWDPQAGKLMEDASIDTTADSDRMEAGRFGDDRAVSIVLPTGYIRSDGKTYAFHKGAGAEGLSGFARMDDTLDTFITYDGKSLAPHRMSVKEAVDWMTPGPKLTVDGAPAYQLADVRGAAAPVVARSKKLDVADDLSFIGLWHPVADGPTYYFLPKHIEADNRKYDVVAFGVLPKADDPPGAPLLSVPLAGTVLDIAYGIDAGPSQARGLYVLTDGSAAGDGRTLYFFRLPDVGRGGG